MEHAISCISFAFYSGFNTYFIQLISDYIYFMFELVHLFFVFLAFEDIWRGVAIFLELFHGLDLWGCLLEHIWVLLDGIFIVLGVQDRNKTFYIFDSNILHILYKDPKSIVLVLAMIDLPLRQYIMKNWFNETT